MYDVKLETAAIEWTKLDFPGVFLKTLRQDERSGEMTVMTRIQPGSVVPAHTHTHAEETVYVLEGDFLEDGVAYGPGSFFVGAAGTLHGPHGSKSGFLLLTTFSGPLDFVLAK
jgi:quercetin dioxygenase-like cupin family protein